MPALPLTDNWNLLWSSLLIAELIKNGIDTFFISPGNRNAPLISVLAYENRSVKRLCFDERAAAYRALGYTRATGRPGVLVSTSGTAPANYYPAVLEAAREDLPLVVLTADRPPELVDSDANQTIDQRDLFGRHCRASLLLPCPGPDDSPEAMLAKLNDLLARMSGPVHINFPFRDPLTPGEAASTAVSPEAAQKARRLFAAPEPYTVYLQPSPDALDIAPLAAAVAEARRGLAIAGRLDSYEDVQALGCLLNNINWPVFCDIASSLRGSVSCDRQIFCPDHPETVRLILKYAPDVILQFGSGLVSKHYYASVLTQGSARLLQVSPRSGLRDPAHRVCMRINAPVRTVAGLLQAQHFASPQPKAKSSLLAGIKELRERLGQALNAAASLSFAQAAETLLPRVLKGEALFLGNSLAIRAFDAACFDVADGVTVLSNRGVSGIEGNIATALGFAEASGRRVTAVIGDMSFLHDLNSLALIVQSKTPVILAVVNNGGGRIFERLPIRNFPEILHPYMTTPHPWDFRLVAKQFHLPYRRVDRPDELADAYVQAQAAGVSSILEIILSPDEDVHVFNTMQRVRL